jgi:hypothetical protein
MTQQKRSLRRQLIQVGKSKIRTSNSEGCFCKYSDVPTDKNGWVLDLTYYPISFDLCSLGIKGKEEPISGWWAETKWTGLRFKKGYKVTKWKRII